MINQKSASAPVVVNEPIQELAVTMVTSHLTTSMESSIGIEVRFGDPVSFEVGIANVVF